MNIREQMAALKSAVDAIVAKGDDITAEELAEAEAKSKEHAELAATLERSQKAKELVSSLASAPNVEPGPADGGHDPAQDGKAYIGHFGGEFVKSSGYEAYRKSFPAQEGPAKGTPFQIEAKGLGGVRELGIGQFKGAVTDGAKATIDTTFGNPRSEREGGLRNYLPIDEPFTFLDLVTSGTTDVPWSEYRQVISETDNAAVVAEGALKPLSDLATGLEESRAYVYADGFDVTNQTLADDGALVAFMDSRIRRHVRNVAETKLLAGTGTGEPRGILNTTGTLAQAFDTDVITTIARALERFSNANDDAPQAIVLHPSVIWNLRLLREDGATGGFLLGNPFQQGVTPSPFGVPLVPSRRIAANTALVGRFDSINFLQMDPLNVLVFNQHKDYAQRNMAYVRAEMRARQLIYAPREIVVTSLAAAV